MYYGNTVYSVSAPRVWLSVIAAVWVPALHLLVMRGQPLGAEETAVSTSA